MGGLATSPLLSRAPMLWGGAQNQKWACMWLLHHCPGRPQGSKAEDKIRSVPACGRFRYITPAVSGVPNAPKRRTKSEVGQHVGGLTTSPLLSRGSPKPQSGGHNQKRARMWEDWLHQPCCLGGPQRSKAEDKIRRGPTCGRFGYITTAVSGVPNAPKRRTKPELGQHVGRLATSPLLSRGSPALQSGGQNQNRAHMWAFWLHHPCCIGGHQHFRAGKKSEMGQHVGGLATSSLLSRGSPALHSEGPNQNRAHMWADWLHHPCCLGGSHCFKAGDKIRCGPTCGRIGCITHAVSGVPNTSEWADWLHHPCYLGGPQRSKAGDKIKRGPACGRVGYITLAVSGIPNASQRGTT